MSGVPFQAYVEPPLAFLPPDPAVYEAAEAAVAVLLGVLVGVEVEHVGSTAVPGLPGKNSINLLVAADAEEFAGILGQLEDMGLAAHPDKDEPADRPVRVGSFERGGSLHPVHVKVVRRGSKDHYGSVFMRDYLKAHPHVASEYALLKKRLVESGVTPEEYAVAKQPFVVDIISRHPSANQ